MTALINKFIAWWLTINYSSKHSALVVTAIVDSRGWSLKRALTLPYRSVWSIYAHKTVRTSEIWKIQLFLFPESIFITKSGCLINFRIILVSLPVLTVDISLCSLHPCWRLAFFHHCKHGQVTIPLPITLEMGKMNNQLLHFPSYLINKYG